MRLIFLAVLATGCVTAGQVHEARLAQVNCIDYSVDQLRKAQEFGDRYEQTELVAIGCRARDAGQLTKACQTIEGEAQWLKGQQEASDRSAAANDARCSVLGANADALRDKRQDQADGADAALLGIQAAGRARQDMAAAQADAPRPIHCTSNQAGAQTFTTCQ